MNLSPLLKKIFFILFAVNILLVAGNIILPMIINGSDDEEPIELTYSEVNHRFLRALHSYSLDNKWIKGKKGSDSVFSYKVDVPKDLPISLLLRDFIGSFDTNEVVISSKELKVRGETEVNVSSGKKRKLKALFTYNEKIKRMSADIGFIISAPELNDKIKNRLIMIPEKFLLLIVPSKESAAFVKELRRAGKEYAVLLNDDTKDLDYKLSPSYSQERLKISVKYLLGAFKDAVCYVYDPSSTFFHSQAFDYEKKELDKRNIKLISYSSFPEVYGEDYGGQFKELVGNLKQDEKQLILISAEAYFNALPEINAFWKKGYKFINPSLIIH